MNVCCTRPDRWRLLTAAFVAVMATAVPATSRAAELREGDGRPVQARLDHVRDRLAEARAERGELARAAADAEQRVADAQVTLEAARSARVEAEAGHVAATDVQDDAERRAAAAGEELDDVTARLDAAIADYEDETARLRDRARDAYKRYTGGWIADGDAVLSAVFNARDLDTALERVELLRRVASRQGDAAAGQADMARRIQELRRGRAQHAAQMARAAEAAVAAANAAQEARTKAEVLARREAATYQAAQELVNVLAQRREDQEETIAGLTRAATELEQRAATLSVTTTSKTVPPRLSEYGNGRIPADALEPIGRGGHRLWAPAASAFMALVHAAEADGVTIGVTDSYRGYAAQVDVARRKGLYSRGGLAARPGTSNHGWGLALDLRLDATALAWMRANADRFGFVEDTPREPWHWGYHGRS